MKKTISERRQTIMESVKVRGTFRSSRNAAWRSSILAAALLLILPCMVKGSVLVTSEETLMQAQLNEAVALDATLGAGASQDLQYNFTVDTSGGSFSYSTLPGQTCAGLSYSVSGTGSYNSSTATYNWTASGLLGSSTWTEQGEEQWTGDDPTATFNGQAAYLNGSSSVVTISGTATVDAMGHSTGNISVNGGLPFPTTDFVPSSGPWFVQDLPVRLDFNFPLFPGNTDTIIQRGISTSTRIPEPTCLFVWTGLGATGLLRYALRRRQLAGTSRDLRAVQPRSG